MYLFPPRRLARTALVALVFGLSALAAPADGQPLPDFQSRGGLPNFRAKAESGGEVRVAYLGGSITAADGWRVLTTDWLRASYPKARFTEIFAAVPGSGSEYGAMRLSRDVLAHHPDLLFVEFAVNDGTTNPYVAVQMESIVRQTWAADPNTDIVFVYTVYHGFWDALLTGQPYEPVRTMEMVATKYGVPSFNFGGRVRELANAGKLVLRASPAAAKSPTSSGSVMVLTGDGTHPDEEGHRLYANALRARWPDLVGQQPPAPHSLATAPLEGAWTEPHLVLPAALHPGEGWTPLAASDPRANAQKYPALVPPTYFGTHPAAPLRFQFKGTVLGFVGLKGPENGYFRVTVDDASPKTLTFFDSYSRPGRYVLTTRFYSKELSNGVHRVTVEVLPNGPDKMQIMQKAGFKDLDPTPFATNGVYLSGVLINGTVVSP